MTFPKDHSSRQMLSVFNRNMLMRTSIYIPLGETEISFKGRGCGENYSEILTTCFPFWESIVSEVSQLVNYPRHKVKNRKVPRVPLVCLLLLKARSACCGCFYEWPLHTPNTMSGCRRLCSKVELFL